MLTELSERKFSIQVGPHGHVARRRLAPLREKAAMARLTLLRAPAGHGKTVLLREWAKAFRRDGTRVVALTLDQRDRDPACLRAGIARAAKLLVPSVESDPILPDADFYAALFAQLTANLSSSVILMLDNAAFAGADGRSLRLLVEAAPPGLPIIAAARGSIELPLARLRAEDDLVELDAGHLRFDLNEIGELASGLHMAGASPGMLRRLYETTEGWPLGVKIALRSMDGRPPAMDRINGCHSAIAEFFEEEVWTDCEEPMRRLLARSSVLEELSAGLCAATCEDAEAEARLAQAVARGLFLEPVDAERRWFRLQPLFRQFLRMKLGASGQDPQLCHRRASEWFDGEGMIERAFDHAMGAGDPERAAEILVSGYRNLFASWRYPDFLRMAAGLPEQVREAFPEIGLAMAWPLAVRGKAERVRQLVASSREELERIGRTKGTFSAEYRTLAASILHREMVQAQYSGRSDKAEQMCLTLIHDYPDADPFTLGVTHTTLIHAACNNFHLRGLERVSAQAQDCYARAGVVGPNAFHVKTYARYLVMTGRSGEAVELLSSAMEDGLAAGYGEAFASLIAIPLAATLYLRNELDRARELIERYGADAERYGLVDLTADLWLTRAQLARHAGDNDKAMRLLEKAGPAAEAEGSERFRTLIAAERIRQLIASGQLDPAVRVGRELGLPREGESLSPRSGVTLLCGLRAMCWTRLAASAGRVAEALRLAGQWATFSRRVGLVVEGVRWQLLQASLHQVNGDQRAAQRSLRGAIADASPAHLVRLVLDEGPAIAGLVLQESLDLTGQPCEGTAFRQVLLDLMRVEMGHLFQGSAEMVEADVGVTGGLTCKELEILSMIGSGKRNADVARIVGMSEGSVKWYLQQIYDKIGVRKRSLAVDRVRQLGLLN